MFSEQFRQRIAKDKYARWAVDLTEDQLEALLSAVGEHGYRWEPQAHLLLDDHGHARAVLALEILADFTHGHPIDLDRYRALLKERVDYPLFVRRMKVVLREVVDSDLPIFFEHQRDPEAARMAAFHSRDQDAFITHWAKLRREPSNIIRTIVWDGQVAGNIGSWIAGDRRLIGYWIGREFWGRSVATAALVAFVDEVKERPLHAFVAIHNVGSIRVLEKCQFVLVSEHNPAIAGEDGIHEVRYMLGCAG